MNQDEVAALQSLQRTLGWKMLVREFQMRRESLIELMLNPDTSLEDVRRFREQVQGAMELLNWPKRQVDMAQPAQEVMRAGFSMTSTEESDG